MTWWSMAWANVKNKNKPYSLCLLAQIWVLILGSASILNHYSSYTQRTAGTHLILVTKATPRTACWYTGACHSSAEIVTNQHKHMSLLASNASHPEGTGCWCPSPVSQNSLARCVLLVWATLSMCRWYFWVQCVVLSYNQALMPATTTHPRLATSLCLRSGPTSGVVFIPRANRLFSVTGWTMRME